MQLLPSSLERYLHNIPGVIQIMFPVFYSTIICAFTAAMGCCTYSPTQFPHHTKPVHFNSLCNLLPLLVRLIRAEWNRKMPTNKRNFTIHYFVEGEKFYLPHELLAYNYTFAFSADPTFCPYLLAPNSPSLYVTIIIIITSYFLHSLSETTLSRNKGAMKKSARRCRCACRPT